MYYTFCKFPAISPVINCDIVNANRLRATD